MTRRSPGLSREAGVERGEAGTRLKGSADAVGRRCGNDTRAIRDQHARSAMAAQNALSVRGLAVARLVIGMGVPLDGVRVEVVVRRLDDGQPEDRRKLQRNRSGGGPPDPEYVVRPQHAGQGSVGDRHPTRLNRPGRPFPTGPGPGRRAAA